MRKIYFLVIQVLVISAFAQQGEMSSSSAFAAFAEAETKAKFKVASFSANANTANYNVGHQTLELTVDPAEYYISGKITTEFTAKESIGTLIFDCANSLIVSSVTKNGTDCSFTQDGNDQLVVTLPSVMPAAHEGVLIVHYAGQPGSDNGAFMVGEHNGTPILATLSEPYGAKDWWPCKQDLNDKTEGIDVYITAPQQYVAVANGLQIGTSLNGNNKTTHFRHNYPIPAYLVAIAVTNYSVYNQTYNGALGSFPIVNYLYPENQANAQPQLNQTLSIMQFFEDTFEQYPFYQEKYGHAQWNWGGGMEHTTVSFMGSFSRELIAHELAHQWFGDKITCGSWQDIWLNEGFATYLSGLVVNHQDGTQAFNTWKQQRVTSITSYPDGNLYLTPSDTLDDNRIFSSRLTYNKGAMVVHMLRHQLGDADFYQGIKNYLADANLAYAYAKTPDLQQHLESVGNTSLDEFFNDWVYNQGYPTYTATANWAGPGNITLTLSQVQSHNSVSFFEAKVPIRFTGTNGEIYDITVNNTFNDQQYTIPVSFTIQNVLVNPEHDLITGNNSGILGATAINTPLGFSLYPNPANSTVNLQLPQGLSVNRTVFYNAFGQKVLEAVNTESYDVSSLSAGLYIVEIETTAGITKLRLIKQ